MEQGEGDQREAVGGWAAVLRAYRREHGLTQAELAGRSAVSLSSVRAYEEGARRPRASALRRMADALGLSGEETAELLALAGYSARAHADQRFGERFGPRSLDELRDELDGRPWPAFVTNQAFEVILANRLFGHLMGVDLRGEYTRVGERSLIEAIGNGRFADRLENWDELVTFMIGLVKGDPRHRDDDDRPLPWLEQPIQRLIDNRPELLARFVSLYASAPAIPHRLRQYFRVVFRPGSTSRLTFAGTLAIADLHTELHWNEWVPADAATWAWVTDVSAGLDAASRRPR